MRASAQGLCRLSLSLARRFFRPTLQSLQFIDLVLQYQQRWVMSDQPVMEILRQLHAQPSLRWTLLPQNTFSSGSVFFKSHQFYWDAIGRCR